MAKIRRGVLAIYGADAKVGPWLRVRDHLACPLGRSISIAAVNESARNDIRGHLGMTPLREIK